MEKCITKCPHLHQLSDKAVIAVSKFVKDCQAKPAPTAQLKNKYVKDKERDDQDFGLGVEKKEKTYVTLFCPFQHCSIICLKSSDNNNQVSMHLLCSFSQHQNQKKKKEKNFKKKHNSTDQRQLLGLTRKHPHLFGRHKTKFLFGIIQPLSLPNRNGTLYPHSKVSTPPIALQLKTTVSHCLVQTTKTTMIATTNEAI